MSNFILYGIIEEQWNQNQDFMPLRKHNDQIIDSLPLDDPWPPLSKEMFYITQNNLQRIGGPLLDYNGRIIHFGANIKATEFPWNEWKNKIETLLENLYWYEAYVHFKPWYGDLATFKWSIHSEGLKFYLSGELTPKKHWFYEGNELWDKE